MQQWRLERVATWYLTRSLADITDFLRLGNFPLGYSVNATRQHQEHDKTGSFLPKVLFQFNQVTFSYVVNQTGLAKMWQLVCSSETKHCVQRALKRYRAEGICLIRNRITFHCLLTIKWFTSIYTVSFIRLMVLLVWHCSLSGCPKTNRGIFPSEYMYMVIRLCLNHSLSFTRSVCLSVSLSASLLIRHQNVVCLSVGRVVSVSLSVCLPVCLRLSRPLSHRVYDCRTDHGLRMAEWITLLQIVIPQENT